MKLNRLETHDRYEHFIKDQSKVIWQGAEECLKQNPDSIRMQEKCHYIYIFAHPRTDDDGVTKRLLWQPRLVKPKAESNSYLFRAVSNTDVIEVCWLLPPKELWSQYTKGNICESDIVAWSINKFRFNRAELEKPDSDDISEERALNIFKGILIDSIGVKNGIKLQ